MSFDHVRSFMFSLDAFLGGSKVLFAVGVEEIPSVRNKTGYGIW